MRIVRLGLRFVLGALFRVNVSGMENVPTGTLGFIIAGAPHRNWVEPLLMHAFVAPRGRRTVTVADARAATGNFLRTFATRSVGGVIAVGAGPRSTSARVRIEIARDVVARGHALLIFPEVGPPSRAPQLRRLSAGLAHIAAVSGASVVPVVFGGTAELSVGRRIEIQVLPPVNPPARSRAAIDDWMTGFRASVQQTATEAHARANVREPQRKHWRWLTGRYPRVD
jgi:1-acyl-sn-glycerol-3-phosphate acyltransferase